MQQQQNLASASRDDLTALQHVSCVRGAAQCDERMVKALAPPPMKQVWEVDEEVRERERREMLAKKRENVPGQSGYQPHYFPNEAKDAKRERLSRGRLPAFDAIAARHVKRASEHAVAHRTRRWRGPRVVWRHHTTGEP